MADRLEGRADSSNRRLDKKTPLRNESGTALFANDVYRAMRELAAARCEALAAVDGTILAGSEGNLSGLAAVSADGIVHLTGSAGSGTGGLAGLTARLAAGGLILEALLSVEFLFTGGEHKFSATVFAYQRLVFVHG